MVVNERGVLVSRRCEIDEFHDAGGGIWVPVKGRDLGISVGVGPTLGKPIHGTQIIVNVSRSSWNSVSSPDIFQPRTIPRVNFDQNHGWREHLSPPELTASKEMFEDGKKEKRSMRSNDICDLSVQTER
jgi:hypothetical protein